MKTQGRGRERWPRSYSSWLPQNLQAGTLLSLGAQYKGGMVVVSGRAKKATLARLLGIEELVVVMPQEPLAKKG